MGNVTVVANSHKELYGKNSRDSSNFREYINRAIINVFDNYSGERIAIDVYNFKKERHNHDAGTVGRRLVIYVNATDREVEESHDTKLEEPLQINGEQNTFVEFLGITGKGTVILSEHGVPLAEWFEDRWELNILFDVCGDNTQANKNIFRFIIEQLYNTVWKKMEDDKSWKRTSKRDELIKSLERGFKEDADRMIQRVKRAIEDRQNNIEDLKRRLNRETIDLARDMRIATTEEKFSKDTVERQIKEFDDITKLEKIKDIIVESNGEIKIITELLYIYASNGKKYVGGEYQIKVNMKETDIRFNNLTGKRKGYWSGEDNHPHVSRSGIACFGSLQSTIAELCSQRQLYALITVCIDFLESANVEDSAGALVTNWDRVGEDGKVIEARIRESLVECDRCGNEVETEDRHTAYETLDDDGEPIGRHRVCEHCLEEHYSFDDDVDEYIED